MVVVLGGNVCPEMERRSLLDVIETGDMTESIAFYHRRWQDGASRDKILTRKVPARIVLRLENIKNSELT